MEYLVSRIKPVAGRRDQLMVRFTLTVRDESNAEEAITFDGCLAGNNAKGLWAWPSQSSSGFKTTKWSTSVTNGALWALKAAGEFKDLVIGGELTS